MLKGDDTVSLNLHNIFWLQFSLALRQILFTQGWWALVRPCIQRSRSRGTWSPLWSIMRPGGRHSRDSHLSSGRCTSWKGWLQPAWPPQLSQLWLCWSSNTFLCFLLCPLRSTVLYVRSDSIETVCSSDKVVASPHSSVELSRQSQIQNPVEIRLRSSRLVD